MIADRLGKVAPEVGFTATPLGIYAWSLALVAGCTFSARCKVPEFVSLSPVCAVWSSTSIYLRDIVSTTSFAGGGEGFQGE